MTSLLLIVSSRLQLCKAVQLSSSTDNVVKLGLVPLLVVVAVKTKLAIKFSLLSEIQVIVLIPDTLVDAFAGWQLKLWPAVGSDIRENADGNDSVV